MESLYHFQIKETSTSVTKLNWSKGAVDNQLQAEFRAGGSCCDQIFALRQIIDKVTALNEPLLVNLSTSGKHLTASTE